MDARGGADPSSPSPGARASFINRMANLHRALLLQGAEAKPGHATVSLDLCMHGAPQHTILVYALSSCIARPPAGKPGDQAEAIQRQDTGGALARHT